MRQRFEDAKDESASLSRLYGRLAGEEMRVSSMSIDTPEDTFGTVKCRLFSEGPPLPGRIARSEDLVMLPICCRLSLPVRPPYLLKTLQLNR